MKILIIGQNRGDIQKYKNALCSVGFEVRLAESAIAGLKSLTENTFKVILLELLLNDMHGLDFIKKLRTNEPDFNTPIVILSESFDELIIKESYRLNVNDYLIKSNFTPEQIADYVKKAVYTQNTLINKS